MLTGTNNTLKGILIIANKKYIIYIGKDLKFTNFYSEFGGAFYSNQMSNLISLN